MQHSLHLANELLAKNDKSIIPDNWSHGQRDPLVFQK